MTISTAFTDISGSVSSADLSIENPEGVNGDLSAALDSSGKTTIEITGTTLSAASEEAFNGTYTLTGTITLDTNAVYEVSLDLTGAFAEGVVSFSSTTGEAAVSVYSVNATVQASAITISGGSLSTWSSDVTACTFGAVTSPEGLTLSYGGSTGGSITVGGTIAASEVSSWSAVSVTLESGTVNNDKNITDLTITFTDPESGSAISAASAISVTVEDGE